MQTFLPYSSFQASLSCLDNRRLGKQRVEAKQILNILLNRTTSNAWRNHPAVLMWKGYENALKEYFNTSIDIWVGRGYKNTMIKETVSFVHVYPWWLGSVDFHNSHKSNLLRKDTDYYGSYGWDVPSTLPYIWPITKDKHEQT